ncbi:RNA polymerase sigma factor [Fluviicola taffensis]|nr:sigma-70 family RNA polymerase sigma factor [Fluviicola taffensis]
MNKLHHKQQSDEELMVQIMGHHSPFSAKQAESALVELHARYSKKLLGYFIKMLNKDVDLAQDFVQEIFLKLLEKKHLFDPDKKFYSWIFTIASNMCKTAYRHHGKTVSLHTETIHHSVLGESELEKNLFLKALQTSIDNLEHPHKTVFVLRYLEHFSLNEIAEITDCSLGTVKSRLFYATKKMTDQLKPYDPSFETTLFKMI